MIGDLILRWVVTGLFALSAAEYGVAIATERRPWTAILNHGLHFVMAVAMVAMAWPWGAQLPTTGPALFFLLAALWFVTVAIVPGRTIARREVYGYHGLMMLATAWMYGSMNEHLLGGRSSTRHGTEPDMSMPDMDMPGMNMPAGSGPPAWFNVVDWIGLVGFAVAVVFWTYRYFAERQHETRRRSLGDLGQAVMAAGMTIFFSAKLFQI